jgi:uncharacterized repeat protein (TIGR01451 family)
MADLELSFGSITSQNGQLIYTVRLVNKGSDTASNVDVAIPIPDSVTFDNATMTSGTYESGVWSLNQINAGDYEDITLTTTINSGVTQVDLFAEILPGFTPDDPVASNNTISLTYLLQ